MRRRPKWRVLALLAASTATPALADTLTGSSITIKSTGSATLSSTGYLGTYLTVPAGVATVNFNVNATEGSGSGSAPHMNLVIADTSSGFSVNSLSTANYATGNIVLPAGTYFVRNERDYTNNVGVTRAVTVNSVSVNTVSGSTATFTNTNNSTNALAAADTYINNFRKGAATVTLTGPSGIPLLSGTSVHVDLARHAFNFGTAVPNTITTYLAVSGTQATNYQTRLNQHFNAVVPENAGKWDANEATRDVNTLTNVDWMLDYARRRNMRARMHNEIWGSQQPSWATTLLASAAGGNMTDKTALRDEITERTAYYVGTGVAGDRANKYKELDFYNESYHTGSTVAGSYWNVYTPTGIADMYREAHAVAPNVPVFVNEYNVYADGDDKFANWFTTHTASLRSAGITAGYGDVVGGIGTQYYPNNVAVITGDPNAGGASNAAHSAARVMQTIQNIAAQGVPMTLTEFGVKSGASQALAAQILSESLRVTFGNADANGFMMWGFQAENGGGNLFAPASALFTVNTSDWNTWTITEAGKAWEDALGIQDWDGNPNNAWDTDFSTTLDGTGTVTFANKGFFGDYYLSGQGPNSINAKILPFDLALTKGTSVYNTALAKPPNWFIWKTNGNGSWATTTNWTDAPQSNTAPNTAGYTAYFGSSATTVDTSNTTFAGTVTTVNITNPVTVTLSSPVTVGMLAFNNTSSYTLNGSAITLQGFNNANGHVAAIYVANGNHTINAPLVLTDNTTATVVSAANTLTISDIQSSSGSLTKQGAGTLLLIGNANHTGGTTLSAGTLRIGNGGTTGSLAGNVTNNAALVFSRSNTLTFGGIISGSGTVSQLGGGTTILSSANTYSGLTTVSSGVLQIGNGGSSGSIAGDVLNNAALTFNRSNALTYAGAISGAGSVRHAGADVLALAGSSSYAGDTTVNGGGTLQVGDSANLGSTTNGIILDNGTLQITADIDSSGRTLSIGSGGGSVDTNGFTLAVGVVDPGPFTKNGAGTLTVTRLEDLPSATINAGTLKIAANGTATGSSNVTSLTVAAAARLDLSDNHLVTASAIGSWNGSAYTDVTALIKSGRNGGGWGGNGIVTSQSQATGGNYTTLAIARGSQVIASSATATALWAGQTITGTDTLIMYTYGGDANLDGKLDVGDYGRIDTNIALPPESRVLAFANGDFNYDGLIDIGDYGIIDVNIAIQGVPFSTGSGAGGLSAVAVPEPASASIIALAAAGLLGTRRRRQL